MSKIELDLKNLRVGIVCFFRVSKGRILFAENRRTYYFNVQDNVLDICDTNRV